MKFTVYTPNSHRASSSEYLKEVPLCTKEQDEDGDWINTININSLEELHNLDADLRKKYNSQQHFYALMVDFEDHIITVL